MNRSKKQSENKENTLMDIVDFIFLLAKTENTSELQPSFFIGNQGNNTKTMEYNPEIEEENSLSTDQSNNAYKKNQNFQEKLLESLMNEENINYSSLINKILMPISKKIIGLIGDFTMAYGRLRELLKKKDLEEKKKAFLRKNIIISPPVKNS